MKKNPDYVSNVYSVFDTIGKRFVGLFYAPTDESMIRTSLPSILLDFPLRDIEINNIGQFDELTGSLIPHSPKVVDTSCYTFPHSRLSSKGDDLTLAEVDAHMKEVKAKAVSSQSK